MKQSDIDIVRRQLKQERKAASKCRDRASANACTRGLEALEGIEQAQKGGYSANSEERVNGQTK